MIKEKIQQNLKQAMIEKNDATVSVLRMLNAAVLNKEKEKQYKLSKETGESKKAELTDEEFLAVISSEIKKIRDALALFEKGQRADLADKAKKEIIILQEYLPEQLNKEEIEKMAKEVIGLVGAESIKDMGRVMGELMPKIKGKADSSIVSKTVKDLLEQ